MKTYNSKQCVSGHGTGSYPTGTANSEGIMKRNKGKTILLAAAAAVASIMGAAAAPARASSVTLQDVNSSMVINYNTPAGVNSWMVDGVQQLSTNVGEWFWYSANGSALASLDTVPITGTPVPIDTNGDGTNNEVNTAYASTGPNPFKISISYDLTGGNVGSKSSDLSESIKITNTGSTTLTYKFIEYTNFNLGGSASPQNLSITNGDTAVQENPNDFMVSQTVVSPRPTSFEANTDTTLLTALGNNTASPLNDNTTADGTDAAFAFEWDITLGAGASYTIGIDKDLGSVPEPTSTVALLGLGGLFLTRPRRRDEDPDPRTAQVAEA